MKLSAQFKSNGDVSMWDAVDKFLSFYSEDDEFLFNISQEDRLHLIKLALKNDVVIHNEKAYAHWWEIL